MQKAISILEKIDSYLGGHDWFVYFLLGTGVFFTLYLGFPQIRYFRHALKIVRGKFDKKSDKGDTSHFQALTTALSGTVGNRQYWWCGPCYFSGWSGSTILDAGNSLFRDDYQVC
jgi:Na+/alanine symporter